MPIRVRIPVVPERKLAIPRTLLTVSPLVAHLILCVLTSLTIRLVWVFLRHLGESNVSPAAVIRDVKVYRGLLKIALVL